MLGAKVRSIVHPGVLLQGGVLRLLLAAQGESSTRAHSSSVPADSQMESAPPGMPTVQRAVGLYSPRKLRRCRLTATQEF